MRILAFLLGLLGLAAASPAGAGAADARARHFDLESGLALHGYDPVSYFDGKPAKGDPRFTATHEGVTYRFATEAHRAAFLAEPSRYEPAYGGWCAWAMLDGDKVEVDPETYKIADGRLLLFYNGLLGNTLAKWNTKAGASGDGPLLGTADGQWKEITR